MVLPTDCNSMRQVNGVINDVNTTVTNISSGTVNALRKTPGPGHVTHYDPRSDLLKAIRDGKICNLYLECLQNSIITQICVKVLN